MLIIGIDPGATGAIASFYNCKMLAIEDMPIDVIRVNTTLRKRVNPAAVAAKLREKLASVDHTGVHVYIENVGSHPRESAASGFTFGLSCGILHGVLATLQIPFTLVTPAEWKRATRTPADKTAARKRASELFPEHADKFLRVKDDGRAEAALIASYGHHLQTVGRG